MKTRIVNLIILTVVLMTTVVAVSVMPDIIPMHFNAEGVADRWGSKYELFIMPLITLLMQVFGEVIRSYMIKRAEAAANDKEREESLSNAKIIGITFISVSVTFALLNFLMIYMSYSQLDGPINGRGIFIPALCVLLSMIFIILGSIIPKTHLNGVIGLRCKWSMYNELTWSRSNRLAGILMMISGGVSVLSAIILPDVIPILILIITTLVSIVVSVIYAYYIYKQAIGMVDGPSRE